jgi:hypothetical protein
MSCILCETGLGRTVRAAVYDRTAYHCRHCHNRYDAAFGDRCPICGRKMAHPVSFYQLRCTNCGEVIK